VAELRSLDLVAREVHRQLEYQLRHFEGIDTKAGVTLGFAGAFVALTFGKSGDLIKAAAVAAAAAGFFALLAFWPRKYPFIESFRLRSKYLTAEAPFTAVHLLDTKIKMETKAKAVIRSKVQRLELSLCLLVAALALAAAGMITQ
jgi:hypothetical protein